MERALYFDLDGTLIHLTEPYEPLLADAIEAEVGTVEDEWIQTIDETYKRCQARGCSDAYHNALTAVDALQGSEASIKDRLLRREIAASRLSPDLEPALTRLEEQARLGVLTNGIGAWQERKLEAFGIDEYFEVCLGCDDAGAMKPEPAPFERAQQEIPAEEYTLVGDSAADRDGAARAGWEFHEYSGGSFEAVVAAVE
jgi:HAD superfamily hydrolase (TIGR01549 family)